MQATVPNSSSGSGNSGNVVQNNPPVANASLSDTYGYIGQDLTFDASRSYDSDGNIQVYLWDFGDGITTDSQVTTHEYSQIGTYHVALTVTDNNGATDKDAIIVTIISANNPPTKPIINGPRSGHVLGIYQFNAVSTDSDNDLSLIHI